MLQQWRDDLPGFLQMDLGNSTPLIPIFQRQRDVLNYTYCHAVILTNRPLLLKGFNTSGDTGTRIAFEKYKANIQDGVDKCLQAALSVTNRVCQMFQGGLMFRSFWVGFLISTIHKNISPSLMYTKNNFDRAPATMASPLLRCFSCTRSSKPRRLQKSIINISTPQRDVRTI